MHVKKIQVPFIYGVDSSDSLNTIALLLDESDKHDVEFSPWPQFPYRPGTTFVIASTKDAILIKFYVQEEALRAYYNKINDPVYNDSCVEFFIAFNEERNYYNLEFNCAGTGLVGFGASRDERELLPFTSVKKIRTQTFIKSTKSNGQSLINWELTMMIPFEVFTFHSISSLKGQICSANFYKCGDELPKPHYLSWNNIISDNPNFHLLEFFGKLKF